MLIIRLRPRKDIPAPKNIFYSDEIRREIGESVPLTVSCDEYEEDSGFINADTTKAIFSLNNKLAHTKDLGINKHTGKHYITALLTKGIRIIKSRKKGV